MDQLIKAQWIKDLLSGKYLQGRGFLRQCNGQDTFYCLGVLFDQVKPDAWISPSSLTNNKAFMVLIRFEDDWGDYTEDNNEGELPDKFLDDVGMHKNAQQALIQLNDGEKYQPQLHSQTGPKTERAF